MAAESLDPVATRRSCPDEDPALACGRLEKLNGLPARRCRDEDPALRTTSGESSRATSRASRPRPKCRSKRAIQAQIWSAIAGAGERTHGAARDVTPTRCLVGELAMQTAVVLFAK
jgi:hypothetical protein